MQVLPQIFSMLEISILQTQNFAFFWVWEQFLSVIDTKEIYNAVFYREIPGNFLQRGIFFRICPKVFRTAATAPAFFAVVPAPFFAPRKLPLSRFPVLLDPVRKHSVIQKATAPEDFGKQCFLFRSWVYPVPKCFISFYHLSPPASQYTDGSPPSERRLRKAGKNSGSRKFLSTVSAVSADTPFSAACCLRSYKH